MSTLEFNECVVNYTKAMRPFALNLTKDHDNADDLLQETVYKALTNKDKYTDGTNLKAWLYTIMKNIFINNYRKVTKRKNTLSTDSFAVINHRSQIEYNRGYGKLLLNDIYKALNSLSEDFRLPFMMHFQGYKYEEIAQSMALPLGTVKSRIFFARKNLMKMLQESWED